MPSNHATNFTHATATAYLANKPSRAAPHGTHTRVEATPSGAVIIRHHATEIIRFEPDGRVILDTDGHHTATTKHRLNNYVQGVRIWQKAGVWYMAANGHEAPFFDGVTINQTARVLTWSA